MLRLFLDILFTISFLALVGLGFYISGKGLAAEPWSWIFLGFTAASTLCFAGFMYAVISSLRE